MSVAKYAQVAVATEAVNDPDTVKPQSTDYDRDSALTRVAAFIPSEAVAVYLALWSFIGPDTSTTRWVVFAIGLALVPTFYLLAYLQRRRMVGVNQGEVPPQRSLRVVLLLLVFAMLAFTAWAMAMPDNPFLDLTDQALKFGGGAVIVLGILMPRAADVLGLNKGD
ncbi:MAG: hypothetical protein ABIS86_06065 [Streptosporangiaceae bacterium]